MNQAWLLDLTDELELTFALLSDTHAWRHRVVEEVTLTSTLHYEVWRGYQIELPAAFVEPFLADRPQRPQRVRVLLPVTTLPKRQLLNFHLTGPDGRSGCLEPRLSTAAVEAYYLRRLAETSGLGPQALDWLPEKLLEAVCLFIPAVYREFQSREGEAALGQYLRQGLGFDLGPEVLAEASEYASRAGARLARALDEPPDPLSSSENVLLALPLLEPRPQNAEEALAVAAGYWKAVVRAEEAGAGALLSVLAEYGKRFEVLTETELPVGAPALVKLSDERPLRDGPHLRARRPPNRRGGGRLLSRLAGAAWFSHQATLGDARSYHLQLGVPDRAVVLDDFEVHDLSGSRSLGIPVFEAVRKTDELLALYTTSRERPYYAVVWAHVRVTSEVLITSVAVILLAWAAAGFALVGPAQPDRFAVLTVPTTFAIALLGVREQTPLGSYLQRRAKLAMLTGLVALWAVVLVRLFAAELPPG